MTSFVPKPVDDGLEARPAPERTYAHDGALLTQDHFRAEQLYHRGQVSRLALHLHGAGTVAGLNVRYDPTIGPLTEVKVAPGLALDRLGRLIELPYESCLNLAAWMRRQHEDPGDLGALLAGLRPAVGGLPDHVVADVYLAFHACARVPEPAFATANADTIDGVQASRIIDAGLLSLVIRPLGDDRVPSGLAASQIPDPVTADALRAYKRLTAWPLTQPEANPFRLPAGGAISEHVVPRQDGSEILLARLIVPIDGTGTAPVFDETIDLAQTRFVPDQSLRPYSYSADEIALIAANLRS